MTSRNSSAASTNRALNASENPSPTRNKPAQSPASPQPTASPVQDASNKTSIAKPPALTPSQPNSRNTSPTRPTPSSASTSTSHAASKLTTSSSSSSAVTSQPQSKTTTPSSSTKPSPTSSTHPPLASNLPRALSANDVSNRTVRQHRPDDVQTDPQNLHWPVSPRLKSPPPVQSAASRRNSLSKPGMADALDSAKQASQHESNNKNAASSANQASAAVKIPRAPSALGSTLETVQEGDHSVSPTDTGIGKAAPPAPEIDQAKGQDDVAKPLVSEPSQIGPVRQGSNIPKVEGSRAASTPVPASAANKQKSFTSLAPAKVRASNEGSSNNMTVETETVSSIPQTSTNTAGGDKSTGAREGSSTLKVRPSSETIRPKKEKKRYPKKSNSIISNSASTKADIFEAKVASEIEGDDTDSDETFVYESNPPEARIRQRHHSRTPSVTSTQSIADRRNGSRPMGNFLDTHKLRGKRSMKFASNSYASSSHDEDSGDRDHAATRPAVAPSRSPTEGYYHHGGYHGRGRGSASYEESQQSPHGKLRNGTGTGSRNSSRFQNNLQTPPRKGDEAYPLDQSDERTPLVGSLRTPRTRTPRRANNSSLRQIEYYDDPRRGWMSRFTGCIVLSVMLILVLLGAAGFLFATTKPLRGVQIQQIENVLASEQEIMMDLVVEATNPNIASITIADMDVNIFAKSRHVNPEFWRDPSTQPSKSIHRRRHPQSLQDQDSADGNLHKWEDVGTDPPGDGDLDGDPQTLLLGRIFHFDSVLAFEGSPLRQIVSNSTGEVRLQSPGSKTEEGDKERWERVLQHPFVLIVRGVLKYQLPLSSHTVTASIGKSVIVHPEEGVNSWGAMRIEQVEK